MEWVLYAAAVWFGLSFLSLLIVGLLVRFSTWDAEEDED